MQFEDRRKLLTTRKVCIGLWDVLFLILSLKATHFKEFISTFNRFFIFRGLRFDRFVFLREGMYSENF